MGLKADLQPACAWSGSIQTQKDYAEAPDMLQSEYSSGDSLIRCY